MKYKTHEVQQAYQSGILNTFAFFTTSFINVCECALCMHEHLKKKKKMNAMASCKLDSFLRSLRLLRALKCFDWCTCRTSSEYRILTIDMSRR